MHREIDGDYLRRSQLGLHALIGSVYEDAHVATKKSGIYDLGPTYWGSLRSSQQNNHQLASEAYSLFAAIVRR